MGNPDYLFVVGLGRSGTTALAQVVSTHPRIVLGMERYKRLWAPSAIGGLTPELFQRKRFLDFSDNLTNITPEEPRWAGYYERAAKHYSHARYVGDKTTAALRFADVLPNFPTARFLVIVRDAAPLAWSWEQRATNPKDKGWPAARDALASVQFWNKSMRTIYDTYCKIPDQMVVVEYDSFFRNDASLLRVLRFLDLDAPESIRLAFQQANSRYLSTISRKERSLPAEVERRVAAERDDEMWQNLLKVAVHA